MYVTRILGFLTVLLLTACGGGGGGGSDGGSSGGSGTGKTGGSTYSVSLSQASINETVDIGQHTNVQLSVTFDGDGLVIGYPPGTSEAEWVHVETNSTSSPASVNLHFFADGLDFGTYNTTLRFVTGDAAGEQITYKDLPVSLSVSESLSFGNPHALEAFSTLAGLAANPQSLHINAVSDWGIEVEYLDSLSGWLSLSAASGEAQDEDAVVEISTLAVPQGNYNARVKLLDADGAVRDMVDVNLRSYEGAHLTASEKTLTIDAAVADLSWATELSSDYDTAGEAINWSLQTDVDWLEAVSKTGSLKGNQILELALVPDELLALENGTHEATVLLEFDNDALAPIETTLKLHLMLERTIEFAGTFSISINSASGEEALQGSSAVKLSAGEAFQRSTVDWAAKSNTDWLTILKDSGDTGENNTLSVIIDKSELATMPNGDNRATITLSSSQQQFIASEQLVTLDLQLPTVDAVGPYVAFSGKQSPLVIHGSGFNPYAENIVRVGDSTVVAEYISPTQVRTELPDSLSVGDYEVLAQNALGLPRASASVKVLDTPNYTAARVALPKPHHRITLDAERQALLFTGRGTEQMDRLQLNAQGEWDHSSFPMSNLTAVELTIDGHELLAAVAGTGITDRILRIDPTNLHLLGSSSAPSDHYASFDQILPVISGQTLLIDSNQWAEGVYLPEWERFNPPRLHGSYALLTRDRSSFVIGGSLDQRDSYVFDADNEDFLPQTLGTDRVRQNSISMSSNASRIVAGTSVYNKDYQLIASLSPADSVNNVAVSPDGNSVYTMRSVDNVANFYRYDISADFGPYIADPEPLPLVLGEREHVTHMIVSDDGGALFVLCSSRTLSEHSPSSAVLYVVPLK